MKIVHLFAATAIALVAVPVLAADTGSFSPQRLSQHIQTLGSDAYEGRGVNTRAEVKTIDYIVGQFKAAGLQPGGEVVNGQRQWTQRVPLLQSEIAGDPIVTIQNAGGNEINASPIPNPSFKSVGPKLGDKFGAIIRVGTSTSQPSV